MTAFLLDSAREVGPDVTKTALRSICLFISLLALLVGLPTPALASSISLVSTATATAAPTNSSCTQTGTTSAACGPVGGSNTLGASGDSTTSVVTASASSSTAFGVLHAFAGAFGTCTTELPTCLIEGNGDGSLAAATAQFSDVFTVTNAPAAGSLVFNWAIDGSVVAGCTASSPLACAFTEPSARADLYVNSSVGSTAAPERGYLLGTGSVALLGSLATPIPFVSSGGMSNVAVSFNLTTMAQCGAFATRDSFANCSSSANLSDTLIITGVSVVDAAGAIVPGATVSAGSRTDYNDLAPVGAVPEPASLVLVGSGLFALSRKARGRSAHVR